MVLRDVNCVAAGSWKATTDSASKLWSTSFSYAILEVRLLVLDDLSALRYPPCFVPAKEAKSALPGKSG